MALQRTWIGKMKLATFDERGCQLSQVQFSFHTEQKHLYRKSWSAWVSLIQLKTFLQILWQKPYQRVLLIIFLDLIWTCKAWFHTDINQSVTFYFFVGPCWARTVLLMGSSRVESNSRVPFKICFFYVYLEDVFPKELHSNVPILMTKAYRVDSEMFILQCKFEKVILNDW
jgi:hypothetical protein